MGRSQSPREYYFRWIVSLVVALVVGFAPSNAHAWFIGVSGTIYADDNGQITDHTGLFVPPGSSKVGLSYTQTITTDPSLNTFNQYLTLSGHGTYGGNAFGVGSCCAAAYTIATTVNGVTYTQTEPNPFYNFSYLIDALSINNVSTTLQDQVYQGVRSAGCASSGGSCTDSYILAYSLSTPFVPTLNFDQSLTVLTGLDPGSNTYFLYRVGTQQSTFYGSIDTISINSDVIEPPPPIPEPSTLALFAAGLLGIASLGAWRFKRVVE